jgi:hypothetical protein
MAPSVTQNIASENEPRSETYLNPMPVIIGISSTTISAKSLVHVSLHLLSVKEIS